MSTVSASRTLDRSLGGRMLALLLAGCLLDLTFPQPVEAQMRGVIGGMGGAISGSWKRIVSNPQRFRIRPKLVIDPQRQASAAIALSTDESRRLVLAIHGDGAAHVWDLERGVRSGGRFGDIIAGIIRSGGRSAEIVAVHRDGSVSALRLDGEHRSVRDAIPDFDARAAPSLSGDGRAMAFRTRDGRWHVARLGTRPTVLRDAAR